jgi:hypothetical protein
MMNPLVALMALSLLPLAANAAPACEARSGAGSGALLELYTSEGCSSCPPADRWFSALAAKADPRRLSLLAFHVDYWDELGWRDRYAQRAFTQRQSRRVGAVGSRTVYTPQVMLSDELNLRWNQDGAITQAIQSAQQAPARADLHLRAQRGPKGWRVDLDALARPGARDSRLYLALYEDGLSSQVRAGENAGALLRHDRVVRGLWGPWLPGARHLDVQAPLGARPAGLGLTAFLQDESGRTLQALSLPLAGCAGK